METEVALDLVEVLGAWAEEDPPGETCSRELGTGSVQTRDVETRTLPGEWSVTNAKLPNPKVLVEVPLSPLVVSEAEVEWECVEAGVWIVVARLEDQVAQGSAEVGEVIVEASEGEEEWIVEVSEAVEVHPWTGWAAVEEEGWALLEESWT